MTVNLNDTESLSSKVVEILAEANKRIEEETGLSIKEVELKGFDTLAGKVTARVREEQDQFNVTISRKAAKKLANKFFDKSGQAVVKQAAVSPSSETTTTEQAE